MKVRIVHNDNLWRGAMDTLPPVGASVYVKHKEYIVQSHTWHMELDNTYMVTVKVTKAKK